jgi:hypothetical protein
MSTTQKALIGSGFTILAAVILWLILRPVIVTDRPIVIGDSSILFSHDSITANASTPTELEAKKLFHKVLTISVIDQVSGATTQSFDVKNRNWKLSSASPNGASFSLRSHYVGTEIGVAGICSSPWQGTGMQYTCLPSDKSQLTPATLTFSDGNCPGTQQATCILSCSSQKCRVELDYR